MSRRNDLSISSLLTGNINKENSHDSNKPILLDSASSSQNDNSQNPDIEAGTHQSNLNSIMNSPTIRESGTPNKGGIEYISSQNSPVHDASKTNENPIIIADEDVVEDNTPRYPGLAPVRGKNKAPLIAPKVPLSLSPLPSSNSPGQPIQQFQSKFSIHPSANGTPKSNSTIISLQSIMNTDDAESATVGNGATPAKKKPKKKAAPKRKTENGENPPATRKKAKKESKDAKDTKDPASAKETATKPKATKGKKKVVEKEPLPQVVVLPPKPPVNLPPPTLLDIVEGNSRANGKTEDSKPPIIALNIPLCDKDAPPGSAQVVFNVMKMAEDKYGWKTMHPTAKFAMELMDDYDDDEDMEDDIEEDIESNRKEKEKEKHIDEVPPTEDIAEIERKKQAQMNRKVGKYDYEDPFIDDEELLWEEEAAATKDGFFVYWGPLIEEGQHARIERADGTIKKGKGGKPTNTKKAPAAKSRASTTKKIAPSVPNIAPNNTKSPPINITPAPAVAPIFPAPVQVIAPAKPSAVPAVVSKEHTTIAPQNSN